MFEALGARLRIVALNLTRKLARQPAQSATGLSLLARHTRRALLGRQLSTGLRGSLLAGTGAGAGASLSALVPSALPALPGAAGSWASLRCLSLSALLAGGGQCPREMALLGWLGLDLAINWAGWAVASALKTEVFYDALGSVSFLSLSIGSLAAGGGFAGGARKVLVTGMVVAWAARLGSFLVSRIAKAGHDVRFEGVKDKPAKFFIYWTMQAVWVFMTLTPVLLINTAAAARPLTPLDAIGIAMYGLGLGIEVVADWQKSAFRAKPENKGRFIDSGLWSLARHPNYFGEMMLWWGVFLTCAPGFASRWHLLSAVCPCLLALQLRYLSGVPPLAELAERRWGGDPAWQAYKERTNLLLPLPRLGDKREA